LPFKQLAGGPGKSVSFGAGGAQATQILNIDEEVELLAIPAAQARDLAADFSGVQNLFDSAEGSADLLSPQKSWHGLHYVLTLAAEEGAPPLNFLMAGGEPLVEEDAGYGPARLLAADDLRAIDAALDAFTEADFDRNFNLT